jgi:hypothetical protein
MRIHPPDALPYTCVAVVLSALSLVIYVRLGYDSAAWISAGFGAVAVLIPFGTWLWSLIIKSVHNDSE